MRGFKRQSRKQPVRELMEKILSASGYDVSDGQVGILKEPGPYCDIFYGDPPNYVGSYEWSSKTLSVFDDTVQISEDKPLPRIRETETGFWEIVRD